MLGSRPMVALGPRSALLLGVALVLAGGAAALMLSGLRVTGGAVAAAGGAALVLAGVGAREVPSRRLRVAVPVADRLYDSAVLAPLAWIWRTERPTEAALALVALALSFVASYERARGAAQGYRVNEGIGYASVRYGLMALAAVTAWAGFLWGLAALAGAAALVRAWTVGRQERRFRAAGGRETG